MALAYLVQKKIIMDNLPPTIVQMHMGLAKGREE